MSAFTDVLRLTNKAGKVPAEIPDHYLDQVRAEHRRATLARIANRSARRTI